MKEAYDFIVNECNIKYNDVVVAAISGGPDSMALLNLLINIKKELNIFIVCAHVNHNVRKESDNEEKFLHEYCNNNGVCFEAMKIKKYGDDNFHNEARSIRYEFFEEIMKKYNSSYLFTAHHGDDLIETILMRIVRGSTLKGYSGFSKKSKHKNYNLIRPLMFYTKDYLLEYDKLNNIPYVIDSSNEKDVYTRNRYRHHVLPFLKQENKNVHQKFYKFSKLLLLCNDYIEKETKQKLQVIYKNNVLNIEKFKSQEKIIQLKIIEEILNKEYNTDLMLISDIHTNNILDLIHSKKSNVKINLPNGKIGIKEYNTFKIVKEEKQNNYNFEFTEYLLLPNNHVLKQVKNTDDTSNNTIRLSSKEIKLPLYVRTKKHGDKIAVKGLNGTKKVKDIFIDEKINISKRSTIPILVDSNDKILWICGLKKSKFDKQKAKNCDIIVKYF